MVSERQLIPHGKRGTVLCTYKGKRGYTLAAAVKLLTCSKMRGVCVPIPLISGVQKQKQCFALQFVFFGRLHKSPLKISVWEAESLNPLVLSSILDPQDNKMVNRETKAEQEERWVRRRDESG